MELIFNDATTLQVQSVIEQEGHLLIKTISATLDELRRKFSDVFACKKIQVKESGRIIVEYNDYITLYRLEEYTGAIRGVVMYQADKTPETRAEVQAAAVIVAQIQAQTLTDAQALTVKALYEQWEKLAERKYVAKDADYKFLYGDDLYKTIKAGQEFQAQWIPGEGTESLFERIDETHAGTKEDPIPWNTNMRPEKDKYYVEGELLAKCIEDPGQALHSTLAALCPGRYFEVAE